VNIAYIVE
jgi:hypothetical protein